MSKYSVSLIQSIPSDEQKKRLAAAYATILTWNCSSDNEPADPENFDEHTEPAEDAPAEDADAQSLYCRIANPPVARRVRR